LFRSLALSKTLAFVTVSVGAALAAFGCGRMPGEPDALPPAWNAEDIALGRCVQTCTPDYGPRPITQEECDRQEAGIEFFPAPVWDFETPGTPALDGTPTTIAALAYGYQDNTTEFLATQAKLTIPLDDEGSLQKCTAEFHAGESEETNCQSSYEPTTAPVDRCGSAHAWHVRGGPFREWGGGIGRRLDGVANAAAAAFGGSCPPIPLENPTPSTPAVCPEFIARVATAPGWDYVNPSGQPANFGMQAQPYYAMQVDLREWEGISFWARRGPDSQPGFRVVLGDLNLDDDASFLETQGGLTPTCQRAKECDCRNHRTCTYWSGGEIDDGGQRRAWQAGWFCAEPSLDLSPYSQMLPWSHELYRCGYAACNRDYPAYPNTPDAPFFTPERVMTDMYVGTASCNTFTFDNDITRKGCFDAKRGPTPPESAERCGDPWIVPVRLGTDWAFYRIPFSEFRQEGYGKEFPAIKLGAVTMVRFTWAVGWIDYWIDDVRFFRRN
jgi:hypothetical protein